jgi:hypothetical protein
VGIFPKKELDHKVIEHVVVFLDVVIECNQLSSFLRYVPNKTVGTFTIISKTVITLETLAITSEKKLKN